MEEVLQEIREERARQDAEWGGPEHDDQHTPGDWVHIIYGLTSQANPPGPGDLAGFRKKMVQVAATAVAAVESLDRCTCLGLIENARADNALQDAMLQAMVQPPPEIRDAAKPDDLREAGWMVAVHNDYTLNGAQRTFWLLTNPRTGNFLKGEGASDAEALSQIRDKLRCQAPPVRRAESSEERV
jgi:hypothetical protein